MKKEYPRLLIEEWLPAAAIGVECIRERSTGQQPPDKRFHVWWARRPLTVSRAAVLASLLPADFPRDVFERLLGFGKPGNMLVEIRRLMDTGYKVPGGFDCSRAFKKGFLEEDLAKAHAATERIWGERISVIDPMAGGGSIPLESARLGFRTLANEYNPVACSILEATVDYPFRYGEKLGEKTRRWGKVWLEKITKRLSPFYPPYRFEKVHAYIYARTVPCPDTQFYTPLVPDWHLLKPKSGLMVVAEPIVDKVKGTWSIRIREIGRQAGQLLEPPRPTYGNGKGISMFSNMQIPTDYIQAKAQAGEMKSALYAVAIKTSKGLRFQPPESDQLKSLEDAENALSQLQPDWMRKKQALLDADSVVYNTASTGIYLDKLFSTMGITEALKAKTTRYPTGAAVMEHVLKGTDKEIGFGAMTEIRLYEPKGIRLVGPLPAAIQNYTNYEAAVMTGATAAEAARAVLRHLATPAAKAAFTSGGVE